MLSEVRCLFSGVVLVKLFAVQFTLLKFDKYEKFDRKIFVHLFFRTKRMEIFLLSLPKFGLENGKFHLVTTTLVYLKDF